MELLWLQHHNTSLPTFYPSISCFYPLLPLKKKKIPLLSSFIEKRSGSLSQVFFLRAWSGRETSVHSSQHKTHKMPNELHLPVELTSGNSAILLFQQQVMVLGEVSTYQTIWNPRTCRIYKTTVVWCFTSSFGKPRSSAYRVMKSNRLFFFLCLMGCFALYFCTSPISK